MRDVLILAIVFVWILYAFTRPHIGILLWSWLGYMNPHRLAYGFAYDFPFSQIVALVLIVSTLITKDKADIPVTKLTVIWWTFILWMGVTTIFAIYPEFAGQQYIKVLKIQLIVFLTLLYMGSKNRLNMLVWVIVISMGFYGVKGGIFTILTGGSSRVWGPLGTYIEDNNALATSILMTIPLMAYLWMQSKNKWIRYFLLFSIVMSIFSAAGSQSRGALLAGASIMTFLWLKGNRKVLFGFLLLVSIPLLLMFLPDTWHERMSTIQTYEEDRSAMGRINAWGYAINVANGRILGGGFDSWSEENYIRFGSDPTYWQAAHSIYFSVLADHGWIGLILFLSIYILAWLNCTWIIKNTSNFTELRWCYNLARMLQVSFVAYATGGTFLSLSYFDFPWHLVSISVLLREISKKQIEETSTNKSNHSRYIRD